MLEKLLEMQKNGIFKLGYKNNIEDIILNAKNDEDIKMNLKEIQNYIKYLNTTYNSKYKISTSGTLSDFTDKFQFEMFDIYMSGNIMKGNIYQKELSYGNGGTISFGISSEKNVKFNLEERKLIRLINHYYISNRPSYTSGKFGFYISFEVLKKLFVEDANNLLVKQKIVEAVNNLMLKKVYWNMENSKYNKNNKLIEKKLDNGTTENLVNISIVYLPREHAKGINDVTNTICGIYCKGTRFMDLRYELKQISNNYPFQILRENYLEYILLDNLLYKYNLTVYSQGNLIKGICNTKIPSVKRDSMKNKLKKVYKKRLNDLMDEIYFYDLEQTNTSYYTKLITESNKKRIIINFIKALSKVSKTIRLELNYIPRILVKGKYIKLIDDNKNIIEAEKIYEDINNALNINIKKGKVFEFLRDGEIEFVIKIQD